MWITFWRNIYLKAKNYTKYYTKKLKQVNTKDCKKMKPLCKTKQDIEKEFYKNKRIM